MLALARDRSASLTSSGGLARDLTADARRRLGVLAVLSALGATGGLVVTLASPLFTGDGAWAWFAIGVLAVSSATAIAAFRGWIPSDRITDVAAAHQIALSLVLAAGWNAMPWPDRLVPSLSPVLVVILTFPVIVPTTRGRTLAASLASAACDPLALITWAAMDVVPWPDGWAVFARVYPNLMAVPAAVAIAHVVHASESG